MKKVWIMKKKKLIFPNCVLEEKKCDCNYIFIFYRPYPKPYGMRFSKLVMFLLYLSWGCTFENFVPWFGRIWKILDLIQLCLVSFLTPSMLTAQFKMPIMTHRMASHHNQEVRLKRVTCKIRGLRLWSTEIWNSLNGRAWTNK